MKEENINKVIEQKNFDEFIEKLNYEERDDFFQTIFFDLLEKDGISPADLFKNGGKENEKI